MMHAADGQVRQLVMVSRGVACNVIRTRHPEAPSVYSLEYPTMGGKRRSVPLGKVTDANVREFTKTGYRYATVEEAAAFEADDPGAP